MNYITTPIELGFERYWKEGYVQLMNGKKIDITDVAHVVIRRESNGTLSYGKRDEKYDGWLFREIGGGGVITIPYVVTEDEVYIGLLEERRPNMGDDLVWSAIGGFIDPGESHVDAQQRESIEESGIDSKTSQKTPGLGIVANRTFFVADAKHEGVQTFFYDVSGIELTQVDEHMCVPTNPSALSMDSNKAEHIGFFRWIDLPRVTADGLALAGAYHLLAFLHQQR